MKTAAKISSIQKISMHQENRQICLFPAFNNYSASGIPLWMLTFSASCSLFFAADFESDGLVSIHSLMKWFSAFS
jgi:hypothetical protein